MIHPRAEVVDLDAALWGDIAVAVQRGREARAWSYVLHCDGVIVNTLPAGLRSAVIGSPIGDPRALACAVRRETGHVRAVILDERGVDAVVAAGAAAARPEQTVAEMRGRVAELYWSSPSVISDPPEPPDDPQLRISSALRDMGPRLVALLRVQREGEFGAAVTLTFEDGLITRCACVDEPCAGALQRTADVWADVEWTALMQAVSAADPWREFAALLDVTPRQRGLDALRSAMRAGASSDQDVQTVAKETPSLVECSSSRTEQGSGGRLHTSLPGGLREQPPSSLPPLAGGRPLQPAARIHPQEPRMLHAAALWREHEARAVTFENPTGARAAGGLAGKGRKGAPSKIVEPGETVQLADLEGPGCVTHVWMTLCSATQMPAEPSVLRATVIEARYDGAAEPSVSVPAGDFFGLAHGIAVAYTSQLTGAHEASGFTSRIPMPFARRIVLTLTNHSAGPICLFYQVDALLGPVPADAGILHATFRRENPTVPGRDFVITDGLRGPGRFLGVVAGARMLTHKGYWWGEGEVKMYFDGEESPTICGTGAEDYLDSAWGLGAFSAPETGAPLLLGTDADDSGRGHHLVGFYRWHLSDPIPFRESLRVTIQQIGHAIIGKGGEEEFERLRSSTVPAGASWDELRAPDGQLFSGIFERSDDWCATAFVYCAEAQPVPAVDVAAATADLLTDLSGLRTVRRGKPPTF